MWSWGWEVGYGQVFFLWLLTSVGTQCPNWSLVLTICVEVVPVLITIMSYYLLLCCYLLFFFEA